MYAQHNDSSTDSRADAAIIGLVLLIGITAIMAGVVVTLAITVGSDFDPDEARQALTNDPDADLEIETVRGEVEITHAGGDTLSAETIEIRGDVESTEWKGFGAIEPGDSVTLEPTSENPTIEVVYHDPTYGEETVLATYGGEGE